MPPTHFVRALASGGGDGSIADAWTFEEALAAAVAGDVVEIGAGVYAVVPENRFARMQPANSGSEDAPIVFQAENRAISTPDAEARSIVVARAGTGSLIGVDEENYIVFDGLDVRIDPAGTYVTTSEGSLVSIWHSRHVAFQYGIVDCGNQPISGTDNWGALFSQENAFLRVHHNHFINHAGTRENHSVIQVYDTQDTSIYRNTIEGCHEAIWFKGEHAPPAT
ncbi:MAG: hypothetical protein V3V08_14475 [Nannocystaceae bacterium]